MPAWNTARALETADAWLRHYEDECRRLLRNYRVLTRMVLELATHPSLSCLALRLLGSTAGLLSRLVGIAAGVDRAVASPLK